MCAECIAVVCAESTIPTCHFAWAERSSLVSTAWARRLAQPQVAVYTTSCSSKSIAPVSLIMCIACAERSVLVCAGWGCRPCSSRQLSHWLHLCQPAGWICGGGDTRDQPVKTTACPVSLCASAEFACQQDCLCVCAAPLHAAADDVWQYGSLT